MAALNTLKTKAERFEQVFNNSGVGIFIVDKERLIIEANEAASKLRIEIDSMPQALDQNEREIRTLEIERQALKKENDAPSKERLGKIDDELAQLKETNKGMRLKWEHEKKVINRARAIKAEIDQLKIEETKAEKVGDLNKVAEIRYGKLVSLQKDLQLAQGELAKLQQEGALLKEEVDDGDVAAIMAKWTKIP